MVCYSKTKKINLISTNDQSTNAFQNVLDESNRKRNKIRVDKGSEFYNRPIKYAKCSIMIYKFIQHARKRNVLLLKDLLEPSRIKFINI